MADNFGLKIGVEGEKEFKSALYSINQSFKVLGSEMKLVESQFSKNDTSIQSLTARNQILNKEIDIIIVLGMMLIKLFNMFLNKLIIMNLKVF